MSESACCGTDCSCCGSEAQDSALMTASTTLTFKDHLGACKVRFGIGRMSYTVAPGLYAIGNPDSSSPVLVSANYKLTFDTLRKNLVGMDCWLLILDTQGVNVWCAAGKGTFGTDELVHRISETGLSKIVTHRQLILPQLGASGVNGGEVARRTGFSVAFGTVRAADIKKYIADGFQATQEMRTVKFTTRDRLVLIPVELIAAARTSLFVCGVFFLINLFARHPFGIDDFVFYAGAVLTGTVLTPLLLPLIPGRAFSWKGCLLGLLWSIFALWQFGWLESGAWLAVVGYLLLLPSVAAYLAMNFTGSSTYTSPSGVMHEMKIALPFIIAATVLGAALVLISKLVL